MSSLSCLWSETWRLPDFLGRSPSFPTPEVHPLDLSATALFHVPLVSSSVHPAEPAFPWAAVPGRTSQALMFSRLFPVLSTAVSAGMAAAISKAQSLFKDLHSFLGSGLWPGSLTASPQWGWGGDPAASPIVKCGCKASSLGLCSGDPPAAVLPVQHPLQGPWWD